MVKRNLELYIAGRIGLSAHPSIRVSYSSKTSPAPHLQLESGQTSCQGTQEYPRDAPILSRSLHLEKSSQQLFRREFLLARIHYRESRWTSPLRKRGRTKRHLSRNRDPSALVPCCSVERSDLCKKVPSKTQISHDRKEKCRKPFTSPLSLMFTHAHELFEKSLTLAISIVAVSKQRVGNTHVQRRWYTNKRRLLLISSRRDTTHHSKLMARQEWRNFVLCFELQNTHRPPPPEFTTLHNPGAQTVGLLRSLASHRPSGSLWYRTWGDFAIRRRNPRRSFVITLAQYKFCDSA